MRRPVWLEQEEWQVTVTSELSNFTFNFHFHALKKEMATHSSDLPGESQGRQSLVGCRLRGLTESDTTEAT